MLNIVKLPEGNLNCSIRVNVPTYSNQDWGARWHVTYLLRIAAPTRVQKLGSMARNAAWTKNTNRKIHSGYDVHNTHRCRNDGKTRRYNLLDVAVCGIRVLFLKNKRPISKTIDRPHLLLRRWALKLDQDMKQSLTSGANLYLPWSKHLVFLNDHPTISCGFLCGEMCRSHCR
jgi:hypothetical protein